MASLGRLSTAVAHDLNNLLTIIKIHANMLADGAMPEVDRREAVARINETCERSAGLLRRVLEYSKGESQAQRELDFGLVMQKLCELVSPLFRSGGAVLERQEERTRYVVRGSAAELEHVFFNLLVNASEAMEHRGGVRVIIGYGEPPFSAAAEAGPDGDPVWVSVKDEGPGVPEELLERIFERGFTTRASGSGLGLALAKELLKKNRGRLVARNHPEGGAEFLVLLSGYRVDESPAKTAGKSVLVVEDDPMIRNLGAQILRRNGFEVFEAASSDEARDIWSTHRDEIGLLFTDIVLAGSSDGRELAKTLRASKPELAVLFTSGFFSGSGEDADGDPVLAKPFHPYRLIEMARVACGIERMPRS